MEYIEFTENSITAVEIKRRFFIKKILKFFVVLNKYLNWRMPLRDSFKTALLIFKGFEFKRKKKR